MNTTLQRAAHFFVTVYEAVRDAIGAVAALVDARVQQARAEYVAARVDMAGAA
jgi:hypothetical protein